MRQVRTKVRLPAKPVAAPVLCILRGDVLTGQERNAANLDHRREWFRCGHPKQPLGPFVCGCKGCGPTCPGYSVALAHLEDPKR